MALLVLIVPAIRYVFFQGYLKEGATFYNVFISEKTDNKSSIYDGKEIHRNIYHYTAGFLGGMFGKENTAVFLPIILGILSALTFYKILEKLKVNPNISMLSSLILIVSPTYIYAFNASTPLSLIIFLSLLGVYLLIQDTPAITTLPVFFALSLFGWASAAVASAVIVMHAIYKVKNFRRMWMLLLIILAGATAGYFMKFDIVYQNQAGNNILKGFISDFGGETGIGIFTLILGLFGLIISWRNKEKHYVLFIFLIALIIASAINSFFITYLVFIFSILAAHAIFTIMRREWEIETIKNLTVLIIFCGIIFSTVSYYNNLLISAPNNDMIGAMRFVNEKANKAYTIFSSPENGFIIEYYGGTVVMDTTLMGRDLQRINDTSTIYYSRNILVTKKLLDKYNVGYIILDKKMKDVTWTNDEQGLLFLLRKSEDFRKIYNRESVEIWEYMGSRR
ncbi:MAG TPA: hypothetical protein VI894_02285 [Candidatus Nanoarchaeia archaeon]|nr:hypothetical protein [Candidatus Nanoarchaeia archaeon]